jgi:hypothetical protein
VIAVHEQQGTNSHTNRLFWNFALPLRLQVDHTLAMPRLVWSFLIFLLPLFGYTWDIIGMALLLFALFYTVINVLRALLAYFFSSPPEKVLIRKYLGCIPAITLYNMFLFWTRMSAVLQTMIENASWNVRNPLLDNLENGNLWKTASQYITSFLGLFT